MLGQITELIQAINRNTAVRKRLRWFTNFYFGSVAATSTVSGALTV